MKSKKTKFMVPVLMVFISFVLVGCGRDVSTVDSALEGRWTVTDARMNGEPLEEVIQEYDEMFNFDSEAVTGSEEGQSEIVADFYYNEGVLTIVNGDGEQTRMPYEVLNTDEENDTLTLETQMNDEEADVTLNQLVNFAGEERDAIASTVNITNLEMTSEEDTAEMSELEQELDQIGQDLAMQLVENIDLEFDLDYVDDSEAPAAE